MKEKDCFAFAIVVLERGRGRKMRGLWVLLRRSAEGRNDIFAETPVSANPTEHFVYLPNPISRAHVCEK